MKGGISIPPFLFGQGLRDAKNDITLSSLQRAAALVGRRVTIELV